MTQVYVTGTGEGVTVEGWLNVAQEGVAPGPPTERWAFRGLFVRDEEFTAGYAALETMGLNSIQVSAFKGSGDTQLKKRLDQITGEGHTGWIYFGSGFTASSSGGSFGISDAKLDALMAGIADHPRNSHRYQVADEIDLTAYLDNPDALEANLATIRARVERIRRNDGEAVVSTTEFRKNQLEPGIWKGVFDELHLDGYANWDPYDETFIPNQAKWCEQNGIPYSAVMSCHEYESTKPCYPTEDEFDHGTDQWADTAAREFYLYVWNDGAGKSLHTDPAMQAHVGEKLATVYA